MGEELQIRTVRLELLRAGPPHNQLLSPLTQYLAICGDSGAGVVTLPYEHASFERRLKDLRYEAGDREDRLPTLHDTGVDMAKVLAAVPGLPGSLSADAGRQGTMIHLRIILSASELALLPFELAKVPVSPDASSEAWLAIQTRPPVCITRHIRTVSSEGLEWPRHPRILFVCGAPGDVPYEEHRAALLAAVEPYRRPGRDESRISDGGRYEQFGDRLTIVKDASLDDVVNACRSAAYTHVHVLAHGAPYETGSGRSFGLRLRGRDGEQEVIPGEQFASALSGVGPGRIHRPAVVTVASCDSANVGDVMTPGGSFAHALHQAGILLVVASQFPLTKEGSVAVAATLYEGLLAGHNPWVLLYRVRAELHSRHGAGSHDWASLVVYEALPANTLEQLELVRYTQAREAIDAALERMDLAMKDEGARPAPASRDELLAAVLRALKRLPQDGPYALECVGLRASALKRLAHAKYRLAKRKDGPADGDLAAGYVLLEQALTHYRQVVHGFLVNEGRPAQRVATVHWVLVQQLSLCAVLGKDAEEGTWELAKLAAESYLDHRSHEERAWAHGSLAELWLLRLLDSPGPDETRAAREHAKRHARELARLHPWGDDLPVRSTRTQLTRYIAWWADELFASGLEQRGSRRKARDWHGAAGLVETAGELVEILAPKPSPLADDGRDGETVSAAPLPAAPAASRPSPGRGLMRTPAVRKAAARRGSNAFLDIEMLPAQHGDCLWIEYGDAGGTARVLVDCGTRQTCRHLMARAEQVPDGQRSLELFVMTHIDADHIGGAIPFLQSEAAGLRVEDVWFNGWRHVSGQLNARQGEIFSTLIEDQRLPWNLWREGGEIVVGDDLPEHELPSGLRLTLLSPTAPRLKTLEKVWKRELRREGLTPGARAEYRELLGGSRSTSTDVDELAASPFASDDGAPNGSSIALLAEFQGMSVLLGADAHPPVLIDSIRKLLRRRGDARLKLDAFKVPHHGSQNNVSRELLELIDCRRYLFSTNGDRFYHPHREAVARIVKFGGPKPVLHFNYRSEENAVWADASLQERYGYTAVYPEPDAAGLAVRLESS